MAKWDKPSGSGTDPQQGVMATGARLPDAPSLGTGDTSVGVTGQSNSNTGVLGECIGYVEGDRGVPPAADGVLGIGRNGVHGQSYSAADNGVLGENLASDANGGSGVYGISNTVYGVHGLSSGDGLIGLFQFPYSGVYGLHTGKIGAGVLGVGTGGYGIFASSFENYGLYADGAKGAASFGGNITINGDITAVNTVVVNTDVILTGGGDCAEHFDAAAEAPLEPGTVVVLDHEGSVRESQHAYDRKVAGVVSGAGNYRPALVLDGRESSRRRALVALVGKVFCKVDASECPVDVGDLLTASSTPGHAMKASDPAKAFGSVIGKALRPLPGGKGLIPILIALQ